jgi:hypothetical protein
MLGAINERVANHFEAHLLICILLHKRVRRQAWPTGWHIVCEDGIVHIPSQHSAYVITEADYLAKDWEIYDEAHDQHI